MTAPDYGGGRQALSDEDRYPDMLVIGVHLLCGAGPDLLDHVNRRIPPPPRPRVIVMTGHLDAQKLGKAQRDGAEMVLLKPFSLGTLLPQLRVSAA